MKTLELSFKSANLKVKHLNLKYYDTTNDAATIHDLMNQIVALKMFSKDNVDSYADALKAEYRTVTDDIIFNDEKKPAPVA